MSKASFWQWFVANEGSLRQQPEAELLDMIDLRLKEEDPRLAAELSCENKGLRELIVTAHGDSTAFASAKNFVRTAPVLKGWIVQALKPPRGFEFIVTVEGFQINALQLRFDPLCSQQQRDTVGLLVYLPLPRPSREQLEKVLPLIIETGIGEEAAARIMHIEIADDSTPELDKMLPITELGSFMDWR